MKSLGNAFIKNMPSDTSLSSRASSELKKFVNRLDQVTTREELREVFENIDVLQKICKQSGVPHHFWQQTLRDLEKV